MLLYLEALYCCFLINAGFILNLYIINVIAYGFKASCLRDNPSIVKGRMFGAFIFTFIELPLICYVLDIEFVNKTWNFSLSTSLSTILYWIMVTSLLYTFDLINRVQNFKLKDSYKVSIPFDLFWLRNYFLTPVVEEIIFRGTMVHLLRASKANVFLSSLFFGLCHLHHFIEDLVVFALPLKQAALHTTVQFIYTTLFGLYCCHILLKSNSILTCIIIHSYCNMMGIPSYSIMVQSGNSRGIMILLLICVLTVFCMVVFV